MTSCLLPNPERILQHAWGFSVPLIINSALEFRLFDRLENGPRSVVELAADTGASPRGLTALLNALVGVDLLRRDAAGYALTPESAMFLVSTRPGYLGGLFRHLCGQVLPNWLQLPAVVRTGQPAASGHDGADEVEESAYFAQFVEALFPLSRPSAQRLGEHLQIPSATNPVNVLDLATGSGVWGITLAQQSLHVRVRAVDFPDVLEVTRRIAARCGVAERLTATPGDLFEADFGNGHQVATLGQVLHSLGAERSRQLLEKTFAALAPGGTIAIAEFLTNPEHTGPVQSVIFAVNMLVHTPAGDTFSFSEISEWLRAAGFVNSRLRDGPGPSPLILATKPPTLGA